MRNTFLYLSLAAFSLPLAAQTFSASPNDSIPDNNTVVVYDITVSGLPNSIDLLFGLETACLNMTHTYDADMEVQLESPDGTIITLFSGVGGGDDNFTNTCLQGSGTPITTANAPFTGNFKSMGIMGNINNGQNPNGVWHLRCRDMGAVDIGFLIDWSISFGNSPAQPFAFSSSNLPIIKIESNGNAIGDEPKIVADMYVFENDLGLRNYLTDAPHFVGNIAIEVRGQSSQSFPKKCYGFEMRDAANNDIDTSFMLALPQENDWILYAPYTDKTLLRNDLIMKMGTEMGRYNSRMIWCELVVNGEYMGIYQVMEKIKRNKNRVDIAKLKSTDISGSEVTGGYIFKIDKGWDGGWESNYDVVSAPGTPINFQYVYPKNDSIQPEQALYLQTYVDSFEQAIASPTYYNNAGKRYTDYIDIGSFVDNFIHNEISRNVDGYRLSSYFHKDKDKKIVAGPLWDFNLSFGNGDYCNGWTTAGWMYEEYCDDGNPFWWQNMALDTVFLQTLRCRWDTLRQTVLEEGYLFHYIDSTVLLLDESQQRNYERWPILGTYVWPNPSPIPADFAEEITTLKQWISNRLDWMDAVIYPITANCEPPVDTTTAIITTPIHINFSASPNPTETGIFELKWSNGSSQALSFDFQLNSILGQTLEQGSIYSETGTGALSLESLKNQAAGVYILNIYSFDKKMRFQHKIIRI